MKLITTTDTLSGVCIFSLSVMSDCNDRWFGTSIACVDSFSLKQYTAKFRYFVMDEDEIIEHYILEKI